MTSDPEDGRQQALPKNRKACRSKANWKRSRWCGKRGERSAPIEVTGDHPGMLEKLRFEAVAEIGQDIVDRYVDGEIDAAYVVFNEFRSVMSQRVVVERLVPIGRAGQARSRAGGGTVDRRAGASGEAALTAGVSLEEPDTHEADEEAEKFGTADVDYIYEQPPEEMLRSLLPRYRRDAALSRHAGVGRL